MQLLGTPAQSRANANKVAFAHFAKQITAINCGSASETWMPDYVEFEKTEFARNGIATFFPLTERSPGKLIDAHGRWISLVLESFSMWMM